MVGVCVCVIVVFVLNLLFSVLINFMWSMCCLLSNVIICVCLLISVRFVILMFFCISMLC